MEVQLRSPKEIMKLSRLGCFHQSKLSFLRSFLEEFKDWKYSRDLFELNKQGYGTAVYSFSKNNRTYSLVCFANELNDDERSDRVIATKWDAAFALHDGIPNKQDIERLNRNVPKQEVGRLSYKELTLSRANRSVRLFNEVVESLSNGRQPDKKILSKVGYLYRTTAVYGSGKFGLADRFRVKNRSEIKGPFRLEMMLVYLVRQFTFDQINHIAKNKNPKKFVELDIEIAKGLGIGNSTGLGMAPFIVNHPTLLNNWVLARENVLKKIREVKIVNKDQFNTFFTCLKKSIKNVENWDSESDFQKNKIKKLLEDLKKTIKYLDTINISQKFLFNEIYKWAENQVCDECLEYLVSIFMEPFDEIVNQFKETMSSDEDKYFTIPTERKISELRDILEKNYADILKLDFAKKENNYNFWFISKNKEEPRLGSRYEISGSDLEQPLAIARDIKKLYERLIVTKNSLSIAEFLIENNDLRHVVRRAFIIEKFPYSEILDNTIGQQLMPIDMLRFKLSFFGAIKFDPRSDKWLRICMFQGAPLPDQLENFDDKWVYETLN
tara:strand:- start:2740 stop:4398 length:1659 start_codon:yes stop_codon:yes gene_type:complete